MRALLAERGLSDLSFAVVASYRADPSLNGLSMKQVAARLQGERSPPTRSSRPRATMMLAGGASMVYHFMSDEDIDRIMRHPQVGVASDSSVLTMGEGVPHPRGYGNNARVLGEYVRDAESHHARGSRPQDDVASRRSVSLRRSRPDRERRLRRHRRSSTARRSATRRRSTSRTPMRAAFRSCSSMASLVGQERRAHGREAREWR